MNVRQLIKKLVEFPLDSKVSVGTSDFQALDCIRAEHIGGGRLLIVLEPKQRVTIADRLGCLAKAKEVFNTPQTETALRKELQP